MEVPELVVAVFGFLSERDLLLGAGLVRRQWRVLSLNAPLWHNRCLHLAATCGGVKKEGEAVHLPVDPQHPDWVRCYRRLALSCNRVLMLSDECKLGFVLEELRAQTSPEGQDDQVRVCDLASVTKPPGEQEEAAQQFLKERFHDLVKAGWKLPDYYGKNLDALSDCMYELEGDYPKLVLTNITQDLVSFSDFWVVIVDILDEGLMLSTPDMPPGPAKMVFCFKPEAVAFVKHTMPLGPWF